MKRMIRDLTARIMVGEMRPGKPGAQILGVYKVPIEITEWAGDGKPHGPHAHDFEHLWLLEIRIDNPDREFDEEDYTQEMDGVPEMEWQIAYEERFLDASGVREQAPEAGDSQRVAFFFHYLDLKRPFRTP